MSMLFIYVLFHLLLRKFIFFIKEFGDFLKKAVNVFH